MMPTRAASAFHAAVHDLRVARLAQAAKRQVDTNTTKEMMSDAKAFASNRLGSMTITMPKATRPPVGLIHSTNKHQRWERAQTAFDAYNI